MNNTSIFYLPNDVLSKIFTYFLKEKDWFHISRIDKQCHEIMTAYLLKVAPQTKRELYAELTDKITNFKQLIANKNKLNKEEIWNDSYELAEKIKEINVWFLQTKTYKNYHSIQWPQELTKINTAKESVLPDFSFNCVREVIKENINKEYDAQNYLFIIEQFLNESHFKQADKDEILAEMAGYIYETKCDMVIAKIIADKIVDDRIKKRTFSNLKYYSNKN